MSATKTLEPLLGGIKRALNPPFRKTSRLPLDWESSLYSEDDNVNRSSCAEEGSNDLDTEVPVLRCFSPNMRLTKADFTLGSMAPSNVVNGRYASNLVHTNNYYLIFNNVFQMATYLQQFMKDQPVINEQHINLALCNDFVTHLRFIYPEVCPDLSDLPLLFEYGLKSKKIKNQKGKYKSVSKICGKLVTSRIDAVRRYQDPSIKCLFEAARSFYTHERDMVKQINRSHCVILNGVPANIHKNKILDFLWDLHWSNDENTCIRKFNLTPNGLFCSYLVSERSRAALDSVWDTPQDSNGSGHSYMLGSCPGVIVAGILPFLDYSEPPKDPYLQTVYLIANIFSFASFHHGYKLLGISLYVSDYKFASGINTQFESAGLGRYIQKCTVKKMNTNMYASVDVTMLYLPKPKL
ncbi:Keratin, type II cytoskeletal 79 [Pichia kudriavzevii]|uniref:Keratin, type II cytoskeletal 79 n=1 Tax=Pichia kudriavzevii TaxID=4909 RepID=A0A1V2LPI9_PICKU|nr:Keratin, type II cytoskeletal 79 [Pichia kudriavzevii]